MTFPLASTSVVGFSATMLPAKLTDRGFGNVLMHALFLIIVLQKPEFVLLRQQDRLRMQIRVCSVLDKVTGWSELCTKTFSCVLT